MKDTVKWMKKKRKKGFYRKVGMKKPAEASNIRELTCGVARSKGLILKDSVRKCHVVLSLVPPVDKIGTVSHD